MADPNCVLLLDSDPGDLELTETILRNALPNSNIVAIEDSIALAKALTRAPADVAVIAPNLNWASTEKVLTLFRREAPTTAIILFGDETELNQRMLSPGRAVAGLMRKNSAGFMALAALTRDVMPAADPRVRLDLDDLPLAAAFINDSGFFTQANSNFIDNVGLGPQGLAGTSISSWCADTQMSALWNNFIAGAESQINLRLRVNNGGLREARIMRDPTRPKPQRYLLTLLETAAPEINVVNTKPRDSGNREMHDIALVFSHDLKEPVQQIMRLVRRLEERKKMDEPGANHRVAEQLHTCAERASAMLDGMLEYLAVSAHDEATSQVDLNECLNEALDNLRGAIDETGAQIVANRLPVIDGDAYQLLHLFQNLIGNAIKFRGHVDPYIRIEVDEADDHWTLAIHDNGIGIADNFREQVFDMGKRLHTREEYPGGGIGLTLCRRIVERHGGSIRIDAGDTGGCKVIINLPRGAQDLSRRA